MNDKQSDVLLRKIIDLIPVHVYWKDTDFRYLGCNMPQSLSLGLKSPDDIVGKTDYDLSPASIADKLRKIDQKVAKTGKYMEAEEVVVTLEGKKSTVLSQKIPLYNDQGQFIGIAGISMDITGRKQLENLLKKSNDVKQEFIANMSHDLRTPITGIMGMLNDLLSCATKIESRRDLENQLEDNSINGLLQTLLDKVENNSTLALDAAERLLQLCNEILETVRLESQEAKIPLESFDIYSLVDGTTNLVKPTAVEKGLILTTKISNKIPKYLFGSARYLNKSLLNLISNALKFTQKGSIDISVTPEHTVEGQLKKGDQITIKIAVSDTGIGIPKEKFEMIFEHFSRLTPSHQGNYEGYGLGLYIVKQYVTAMNGTISIDRSVLGKGTTFVLTLPFTVDDHADDASSMHEKPIEFQNQTRKKTIAANQLNPSDNTHILIVEDTLIASIAAQDTLEKSGCHSMIDFARTGEVALKKIMKNNYDLILMDIGLPKMQGTEVTQKIRALDDPIKSKVPIVALTGHADPEHKKEFLNIGMNDLIIKPANIANITRVLEAYVFPKVKKHIKRQEKQQDKTTPEGIPIFDKEASLQLEGINGDKHKLQEYVSILSGELKIVKKVLLHAYRKKDIKALRNELHRIRGGLTYLAAPELTQTMKAFHDAIKATPKNHEKLEQTYQAAIQSIDRFQKAFASPSFPRRRKSRSSASEEEST